MIFETCLYERHFQSYAQIFDNENIFAIQWDIHTHKERDREADRQRKREKKRHGKKP